MSMGFVMFTVMNCWEWSEEFGVVQANEKVKYSDILGQLQL